MKPAESTTPALHLEQARVGERTVSDADAPAVAALRDDDAAFLATMPAALAVPQVQAEARRRAGGQGRVTSTTASRWQRWLAVAALPACAAAVLVSLQRTPTAVPTGGPTVDDSDAADVVRAKGSGAVLVAAQVTSAGAVPVSSGTRLSAGDVLQLGWQVSSSLSSAAAPFPQGVVVSIDGRGAVTQHLPLAPSLQAPLLSSRGVLPSSYELDDAERFERFFLVTGPRVDVEAVVQAARALAASPASETAPLVVPSLQVSELVVRK